jgi:hypothetical protein
VKIAWKEEKLVQEQVWARKKVTVKYQQEFKLRLIGQTGYEVRLGR